MNVNSIISVILAAIAHSLQNIGFCLEKKGASDLPKIEEQSFWQNVKNFMKCKVWLLGYLLTVLHWFLLFVAINIGSLTLIAPVMAVGLIALVLFAWFYLKEPITIIEIIGIISIIFAIIAITVSSPSEEAKLSLEEANESFLQTKAIIFLVCAAALLIITHIFTFGKTSPLAGIFLAIATGFSHSLAIIFMKGSFGSIDMNNFFKSFWSSIGHWEWWVYLFLMLACYAVTVIGKQLFFQKGKAVVVSPIYMIMSLSSQVLAGIIIFNEWVSLDLWQILTKCIAIIFIVVGVVLLSSSAAKAEEKLIEDEPTLAPPSTLTSESTTASESKDEGIIEEQEEAVTT